MDISLEKSLELYNYFVKRLEKSGHAPNQLEYYKECIDFIKGCATGEEAMEKMRNSHLYTAGGNAAAVDDLLNRKWAAERRRVPELVDLYGNRYEEVKGNPDVVFDYENVLNFNSQVTQVEKMMRERKEAFLQVCQGYLEIRGELSGTEEYEKAKIKIKGGCEKMEQLGKPFPVAITEENFRNLIFFPDKGFNKLVEDVMNIMDGADLLGQADDEKMAREWEEVRLMKETVKEIGRGELAKQKRGMCFCEPSGEKNGKYTYSHEIEEV